MILLYALLSSQIYKLNIELAWLLEELEGQWPWIPVDLNNATMQYGQCFALFLYETDVLDDNIIY